jgi:hypothetical protein
MELVSDPPGTDVRDTDDPLHVGCGVAHLLVDVWLDAVEHADEDGLHGLPHDAENRDRDEQPHDRVRFREAVGHAERSDDHGQAGPSIRPRVIAVRDQRRAADLLPHADAEHRDSFVSEKPDD